VFADIHNDGIRQTWPVQSRTFSRWLARTHFDATGKIAPAGRLTAVVSQIEAEVQAGYPEREVFRRVGKCEGRVYLDLADAKWRTVEVDSSGFRVAEKPPIRFVRTPGMLALPAPEKEGSIEGLRSLVNLDDESFTLVVAWLLGAMHPEIAKPILAIRGGEGSAKSTLAEILRGLIDPYDPPYTGLPATELKLSSAVVKSYCQAYDNVSGLKRTMSDAICRFITDGSNQPVIINGISDVVVSADLADRCIFIESAPIPDTDRRTYSDVKGAFEKVRPAILGALLDAVAQGLRNPTQLGPDGLPRMADFAQTSARCETAFWPAGTFMAAYDANRAEIVDALIEASPVASAVRSLTLKCECWEGQANELDDVLRSINGNLAETKGWPSSPQILVKTLRELAPALLKVGIEFKGHRSHDRARRRLITITARMRATTIKEGPSSASAASAPDGSVSNDAEESAGADSRAAMTDAAAGGPTDDQAAPLDAADAENQSNEDNSATASPSATLLSKKAPPTTIERKDVKFVGNREIGGKLIPVLLKLTRGEPKKPALSWPQILQRRLHNK
jgi:hypothetical protein